MRPIVVSQAARHRLLLRTPLSVRRRWWYWKYRRRWLHLRQPITFTEKITWRIVKDRRPVLQGTCDKLAMKSYARERAGELALRVPETYWTGTDLAELATASLPRYWVLKPNHRSGLVALERGTPDIAALSTRTSGWLADGNWAMLGEWAYKDARRVFVVEEQIGDAVPTSTDYKVFVFDGQARLICVIHDRFTRMSLRYYTPDWEPLPYRGFAPLADVRARPPELSLLLQIAQRVAEPFDFMRIDLYIEDGEIWFGELTPYSGGGFQTYDPPDLDATLGSFWQLPELNRAGYLRSRPS